MFTNGMIAQSTTPFSIDSRARETITIDSRTRATKKTKTREEEMPPPKPKQIKKRKANRPAEKEEEEKDPAGQEGDMDNNRYKVYRLVAAGPSMTLRGRHERMPNRRYANSG